MEHDCDSTDSTMVRGDGPPRRKKQRVDDPRTVEEPTSCCSGNHPEFINNQSSNDTGLSKKYWWRNKPTKVTTTYPQRIDDHEPQSPTFLAKSKGRRIQPPKDIFSTTSRDHTLRCHVCCQPLTTSNTSVASHASSLSLCTTTKLSNHPHSVSVSTAGTCHNGSSVSCQEEHPKQQISLWSFFHPTRQPASASVSASASGSSLDAMNGMGTTILAKQEFRRNTSTAPAFQNTTIRDDVFFHSSSSTKVECAYCDRPVCHSCRRACEGGCHAYYCTFCSYIDYQGVVERVFCFACREDEVVSDEKYSMDTS